MKFKRVLSIEEIGSQHKTNAFDILRVAAALGVLVSHSYALYGLVQPNLLGGRSLGTVCVDIFFAISGYLVAQSWLRDPSALRFMYRRALRIFPGLIVAVLITVFVIGVIASRFDVLNYFSSPLTWNYILVNAVLLTGEGNLPGVFEKNPYPLAINGSLWTLRYEILMYVLLALIGLFCKLTGNVKNIRWACLSILIIFIGAGCVFHVRHVLHLNIAVPYFWRMGLSFDIIWIITMGTYFFVGASLCFFDRLIRLNLIFASGIVVIAPLIVDGLFLQLILWLFLPYWAICFAWKAPTFFKKFKGFDYSYGIYIYAWPIQQLVAMGSDKYSLSFESTLAFAAMLTIAVAAISWHWVEQPALALKPKIKRIFVKDLNSAP